MNNLYFKIDELYNEIQQLSEIISQNVEIITKLEGYGCILSSEPQYLEKVSDCGPKEGPADIRSNRNGSVNERSMFTKEDNNKKHQHQIHDKRRKKRPGKSRRTKYYTQNPYTLK